MKIRLRGRLSKPAAAEGCLDPDKLVSLTGDQTPNQLIQLLKQALLEADECLAEKFRNNEDVNNWSKPAPGWLTS